MQSQPAPTLLTGQPAGAAEKPKEEDKPDQFDIEDSDGGEAVKLPKKVTPAPDPAPDMVGVSNPFAVAQLGENIILTFRRKSLALIVFQTICVNVIAFCVDRLAPRPDWHWMAYVGTWIFPVMVLFILNYVRRVVPLNFVLVVVFSASIGVALGLLHVPMQEYTMNWAQGEAAAESSGLQPELTNFTGANSTFNSSGGSNSTFSNAAGIESSEPWKKDWPLQCYAITAHTMGLALLMLLTCFKHPAKGLVKVMPVSIIIAIVTDIAFLIGYVVYRDCIPPLFAITTILMSTLSIVWIGYQMDRLTRQLQVEEWVYPLILLWCEVFSCLLALAAILLALGAIEDCPCEDSSCCQGCYGCFCDCYYGGAKEEQNRNSDEPASRQETVSVDV
eukprot:TRINITY_DN16863_c0_g1_i1.p1 TRINITY_DN16863_c0_g1~~TRINITY_DN16863_c0_g1_i1.p1  ORF type:complete len:389 (-),score=61.84 TRINITY_DN16863_c0_g1_i1:100-1266(-)